jgi:hypothetical protein
MILWRPRSECYTLELKCIRAWMIMTDSDECVLIIIVLMVTCMNILVIIELDILNRLIL